MIRQIYLMGWGFFNDDSYPSFPDINRSETIPINHTDNGWSFRIILKV